MPSRIPAWKLRREWRRLKEQVWGIVQEAFEPRLRKQHDTWFRKDRIVQMGARNPSNKIALFLIYQPGGLPRSIFLTLQHLIENGYAPLVVSNAPLSDKDREGLHQATWQFFERPNFGYDFGGYQDGIRHLIDLGTTPEHLLILNDSVWFPVIDNSDLIAQMEQCDAEFVGVQGFHRPDEKKSSRKWAQPFFGSYFLMFTSSAVRSAAFQAFWMNYKPTSSKHKTLYRGERELSYRLFDAGLRSQAIFTVDTFAETVGKLSAEQLEEAIEHLVCTSSGCDERRSELRKGQRGTDDWCQSVRDFLVTVAADKNYIGSMPTISLNILGLPMIKKNNQRLYHLARDEILRAYDAGHLPNLLPEIVDEIRKFQRT